MSEESISARSAANTTLNLNKANFCAGVGVESNYFQTQFSQNVLHITYTMPIIDNRSIILRNLAPLNTTLDASQHNFHEAVTKGLSKTQEVGTKNATWLSRINPALFLKILSLGLKILDVFFSAKKLAGQSSRVRNLKPN